ncbi:hypothetical protein, conserved [Eimeria maxima]|uniref:Uncharacterized protein n=1 Tax=Eimeria maxima TaxID=5804 RepID=U6M6R3_EIMMA|nr:hypothetical protein, conserved [Eimeria maxima]CDJ59917.1 hypothetical protein, conserved [Eimeria maxima]
MGVWRSLVLLSFCQCCLQWAAAASKVPQVYQQWETAEEFPQPKWRIGAESPGGVDPSPQMTLNVPFDGAPIGAEIAVDYLEAPAVEGTESLLAEGPKDGDKAKGAKLPGKGAIMSLSMLLFLCAGLLAIAKKKGAAAPAAPTEEEITSKPPDMSDEEYMKMRLERVQKIFHTAEKMATLVGSPEASGVVLNIQKALENAKKEEDPSTVEEHLKLANGEIGELHQLLREYIEALDNTYSRTPPLPVLALKEGDKDVPIMQVINDIRRTSCVRGAVYVLNSLREKSEREWKFFRKLAKHITKIPNYQDENDEQKLEHVITGVEYLKSMGISKAHDLGLGEKMKEIAVEGLHEMICRDRMEDVLHFENDLDLLKISVTAMQRRHPPPGIEPEEYTHACSVLESRLGDLQGVVDDMYAHLVDMQQSRSLQVAFTSSGKLEVTLEMAKDELRAVRKDAASVDMGFDAVGKRGKELIPDKVFQAPNTVSSEQRTIRERLRKLRREIEKYQRDRARNPDDQSNRLNDSIPANILSSIQGTETATEVILNNVTEKQGNILHMAGQQEVTQIVRDHYSQLVALRTAQFTTEMLDLDAKLFLVLEEELRRQIQEGEEAASFVFPEDSSSAKKLLRLKRHFDEEIRGVTRSRSLTDAGESLLKTRAILDNMNYLIREALMHP